MSAAGWLPDGVDASDLPLLEVDECDPFNGAIMTPNTPPKVTLW